MSHFFGRRFISGTGTDGYGVSDHGELTGLYPDDDHPQYLIISATRVVDDATSGIEKTGITTGDVFTIKNAGAGAALFIQQTGDITSADAAVDIDNTNSTTRALGVFSSSSNPAFPLVQFSVTNAAFDEPVLLITHNDPRGLALQIMGDAYVSGQISGPEAITFTNWPDNPIPLGTAGIYIEGEPGIFYFVDKDGTKYTFGDSNFIEGDGIDFTQVGIYREISVDVNNLFGTGLGTEVGLDGYLNLRLDADASMISYDDSESVFVVGSTVQEALDSIDGYLQSSGSIARIHKFGEEADNYPFNSVYSLDGYSYDVGKDKLIVSINGLLQNVGLDYIELSSFSIEFADPLDNDDEVDIIILPNVLGSPSTPSDLDVTLQRAYDNSPSGAKSINLDDGQITFTQTLTSGSVLRLISNTSVTTAFTVDQSGSGEAARLKSVDGTASTLLVQKDATSRNSVLNTVIIDRTTSHVSGGLTGIGSAILTRLENTGSGLFNASRIITGTESASDSIEDTFWALELMNDGIMGEVLRVNSLGNVGIGTNVPNDFKLQVAGDVGPDIDLGYNLGSPSKRWRDGYFGSGSLFLDDAKIFLNSVNKNLYYKHPNGSQFDLIPDYAEQFITSAQTTIITDAFTAFKLNGSTEDGYSSSEFDITIDNRLKYIGTLTKKFAVGVTLTINSDTNNHDVAIGFFKNGVMVDKSIVRARVNTIFINASTRCIVEMDTNDYIEVFLASDDAPTNLIIERMNFTAIQL